METAYDIIFFWVARMMMLGIQHDRRAAVRDRLPVGPHPRPVRPEDVEDEGQHGRPARRRSTSSAPTPSGSRSIHGDDPRAATSGSARPRSRTPATSPTSCGTRRASCSGARPASIAEDAERRLPDAAHLGPGRPLGPVARRRDDRRRRPAMADFNFGEVTRLLYDAIWNEYCDWGLELAKVRLADATCRHAEREATWWALVEALDTYLRLLHPVMPFITETLWEALPHRATDPGLLIVARWPGVGERDDRGRGAGRGARRARPGGPQRPRRREARARRLAAARRVRGARPRACARGAPAGRRAARPRASAPPPPHPRGRSTGRPARRRRAGGDRGPGGGDRGHRDDRPGARPTPTGRGSRRSSRTRERLLDAAREPASPTTRSRPRRRRRSSRGRGRARRSSPTRSERLRGPPRAIAAGASQPAERRRVLRPAPLVRCRRSAQAVDRRTPCPCSSASCDAEQPAQPPSPRRAPRAARRGRRAGLPAQALLRGQEQRGRADRGRSAGPGGAAARCSTGLDQAPTSRSSSRSSSSSPRRCPMIARPSEAMQWLNAHHRAEPDHAPRARRPRVDRRGRPRLRHVRLRAARRRDRHVRVPRVQRGHRRRRVPLGRGDGRHDRPRRRRAGAAAASAATPTGSRSRLLGEHPGQHPRQPVRDGPHGRRPARARRPGRGGLVCAHCGFASGHERAFYCPKCGMRLLRG